MLELSHKELAIPGLTQTYRILHITDAHVVVMDQRDEGVVIVDDGPHHGKLVTRFGEKRYDFFTTDGVTTAQRFEKLCEEICRQPDCADLILFTGDILDFFTESCMQFVTRCLKNLPIPYMFVMGNHDSIFYPEGEEDTRKYFRDLCGGNTELQKYTLGELTFIGIDNARDRYTENGLALLKDAMEGEKNVILCQHIPLSNDIYHEEGMRLVGADHALGNQGVCVGDSWKTVFDMIEAEASPIRALICGDCHRDHRSMIGNAVMFTSACNAYFPPALFTIHS